MHAGRKLAKVLVGEEEKVAFSTIPLVVMTTAHRILDSTLERNTVGT
jgi:hypothetical protein